MPVRIDQFEEVDASVFDQYPQPAAPGKKVDPQWEELLTKLDQGSVIRLPLGDETELRGLRLALADGLRAGDSRSKPAPTGKASRSERAISR